MLFYAIEIIFRLILFAGGSIINSSNSFLLVPSACLSYSIHCTCLIPTRAAVRMAKRPVVVYYYRTVSCNCRFRPVQFTIFLLSALYGHCLLFATIRLPYLRRKVFKFFFLCSNCLNANDHLLLLWVIQLLPSLKHSVSLKRKCKTSFQLVQWWTFSHIKIQEHRWWIQFSMQLVLFYGIVYHIIHIDYQLWMEYLSLPRLSLLDGLMTCPHRRCFTFYLPVNLARCESQFCHICPRFRSRIYNS